MNKKAQGGSGLLFLVLIILLVVLLAWGFLSYANNKVVTSINTAVQQSPELGNESLSAMSDLSNGYASWSDNTFAVIFGLLWLCALIMSYYVDSNPLMFLLLVVFVFILIGVAMLLSNTWASYESAFDGYSSSFPITNFVLNNYALVIMGVVVSCLLTAFLKNRVIG